MRWENDNISLICFVAQGLVKRETRFTSKKPANEIISKIEEAALPLGFDVKKNNYKVQTLLPLRFLHNCQFVLLFVAVVTDTTQRHFIQLKLVGEKTGRKGHLAISTEVHFAII